MYICGPSYNYRLPFNSLVVVFSIGPQFTTIPYSSRQLNCQGFLVHFGYRDANGAADTFVVTHINTTYVFD